MIDRPDTDPPTDPVPDHDFAEQHGEQRPKNPASGSAIGAPGGLRPTLRLLLAAGHSLADLNAAGRALQQRRAPAADPDTER